MTDDALPARGEGVSRHCVVASSWERESLDLMLCALRRESLLAQLLRTRSGDTPLKSTGSVGRQPQMTAMAHSSWVQYMVGAMKTAGVGCS